MKAKSLMVVESPMMRSFAQNQLLSLGSSLNDTWVVDMAHILRHLMDHERNQNVFNSPVDVAVLPTYYQVIQKPMDFGTIKNKLEDGEYRSPTQFANDVHLVFSNALVFNAVDHPVHKNAIFLRKVFDEKYWVALKKIENESSSPQAHTCDQCEGRVCAMCNRKCLEYALPEIRCSPPCKAKIPRNAPYWRLGGERGQHWCARCYSALKDEFIGLLGQKLKKADLEKFVNNETYRESWVECTLCHKWSHEVCALYLKRYADPENKLKISYVCLSCIAREESNNRPRTSPRSIGKNRPLPRSSPRVPREFIYPPNAESLPKCSLSDFIENNVRTCAVGELSKSVSMEDANRIANSLIVRVVSNVSCEGLMEARIRKWVQTQAEVAKRTSTVQFPHREKTICIFQEEEEIGPAAAAAAMLAYPNRPKSTIMLFALYVQEYGSDCPESCANRGCVYISYLDSVPYMKPRRIRPVVFREIMTSYLSWVRMRGFRKCYIWACPPHRGDSYVMFSHPGWQRTPNSDRLRKWYGSIFAHGRKQGIVDKDTTLFDLHLSKFKPIVYTRRSGAFASSSSSTSTVLQAGEGRFELDMLPYFSGDFVQGELEIILSQLELFDSDLTQTKIREWWLAIWGPVAVVDLIPIQYEDGHDVSNPFDSLGIPRPSVTLVVKPSAPVPTLELLNRLENETCTYLERDEWIMRKISATVRPQKDNFLVVHFNKLAQAATVDVASNGPVSEGEESATKRMKGDRDLRVTIAELKGDLSDPDPPLPKTIFDYRLGLMDFCIMEHLQFDTLRRARYSTAALLCLLHRSFEAKIA